MQQTGQLHHKELSVAVSEDGENGKMVSLYQIVKGVREDSDRPPIARILYSLYINEGVKNQKKIVIQKKIEELMKQFEQGKRKESLGVQNGEGGYQQQGNEKQIYQNFTGCFIEYGLFCLHLLEGESSQINSFMGSVWEDFHGEKSVFSLVKIICFVEENPTRMSDKFFFEDVQNPTTVNPSSDQEIPQSAYQDKTWEVYQSLCKAVQNHSKKGNKERQQKKIHSDFKLSSDDMTTLLSNYFMNIDQYYQFYLDDVEITLDGEKEFPYKASLTKVLEYSDNGTLEEVQATR